MIEVNNLTGSSIDKKFLKRIAKTVLKSENREETMLSIVLVGEGRIKELNKKYRGKNSVTDVLSFGEELNEIVICLVAVEKNAEKYNIMFKKEVCKKCKNDYAESFTNIQMTSMRWTEYEDKVWKNGMVYCPLQYTNKKEEQTRDIIDEPPSKCPYVLENTV